MELIVKIVVIIVISYLIGSFPTALIISKSFFGFDIRDKGSGNMGSTNTFRILGWKWGIIVQIVDILKGLIPVILFSNIFSHNIVFTYTTIDDSIVIVKLIAGVASICGHIWTIFAKFKGGKGINTALGAIIAIAPIDLIFAIIAFALILFTTGYVSLGSITGSAIIPLSLFIRSNVLGVEINGYDILIYFFIVIAGLLIFTHRKNIVRLLNGTENRFEKLMLFRKK